MTDALAQDTHFTPVETAGNVLSARAQCYDRPIAADHLRRAFPQAIDLGPGCWLIERKGSQVVVVEFGAVACWSPSAGEITTSAAQVEHALGLPSPSTGGDEQLSVRVNEPDDAVTFRDLRLKRLTREHLRLVSEVLAKSAALRAAEKLVDDTITQNAATVRQLSERGRIGSSSKQVLQAVGFTLAMRERLLARLNVFGTPPETWDSERLYKLYERLADHFDLRPRAAGLETKLEYLSDLSTTLLGFLEHREGKRLEWIVIILIVIEVIFSTIHFFEPKH